MNAIENILIALLLLFMSIHVASAMMMVHYALNRGEDLSIFFLRVKIFSAIGKYRNSTKQESGRTGYLFYLWIFSANLALCSFIAIAIINLLPYIHEYVNVISNTRAADIITNIFLL